MEAASIESEEKLATRVGWFTRYIDFMDTSRWNFYVPIPPPAHGSWLLSTSKICFSEPAWI
jgi:hypothetical protein